MSSLPRRMQRNAQRRSADNEHKPQVTHVRQDGSYLTLHPTNGWRYISRKRLDAQTITARMLDHVILPRAKKPAKLWRRPAKVWPSTETRQQRRAAQRGYRVA